MKPRDAMRQADAAIVGRLVKAVPRNRRWTDYRYGVQRVYKAGARDIGLVVSVRSSKQAAACGLPSREGQRYGLFLSWDEGRWWGGLCGTIAPRRLRSTAQQMSRKQGDSAGSISSCTS